MCIQKHGLTQTLKGGGDASHDSTFPFNAALSFCDIGTNLLMEQWTKKGTSLTQHARIDTAITAAFTSSSVLLLLLLLLFVCLFVCLYAFFSIYQSRFNSVLHFSTGPKYTSRCHGIQWSIAPLSAKIAETQRRIERKSWMEKFNRLDLITHW